MTDEQIQQQVENGLDWADPPVDGSRIQVTVYGGVVTLRGDVDTRVQMATAGRVALLTCGVTAVVNDLALRRVARPTGGDGLTDAVLVRKAVTAGDVLANIESAFLRTAEADARSVRVQVLGGQVILQGHVHSWFEREEARRVAWAAPGVTTVVDQLAIVP